MSGGRRYWNEDTQRWEDGEAVRNPAPATPPPPARPQHAPDAAPPGPVAPDAEASGEGRGTGPSEADVAWWQTQTQAGDGGVVEPVAPDATDGSGVQPFPAWPADAGRPYPDRVPPAPAAPGGLNRRVLWSVVVGAAVVGVGVSLVLSLVIGPGDDKGDKRSAASAATTPGPTGATESSGAPSPTGGPASPSTSPSALPTGYASRDDGEGFRIAVPEGWTRSTVKSTYGIRVVNYRSADHSHRIQVYQVAESSPDASFELYLSAATAKPAGFKEISLRNLDDGEFTGSRLEYLADTIKGEPAVGPWHVYDERFVAADGNIYAIAVYGPDADGRDDELQLLTTALNWFCPPGATCDPAPA
ncbi:hypothetical protein ACFVHS_32305 [Streptomyces sp. NPDC057746]|uniref:hypothetical protein n=1 Tax=Streptomyces sp. NPDC057746 TaxID=3346237 RepID=UPI00369F4C39